MTRSRPERGRVWRSSPRPLSWRPSTRWCSTSPSAPSVATSPTSAPPRCRGSFPVTRSSSRRGVSGAGRWADRLGRRRVFLAGMAVFTVASALCAVAPGVGVLVAARVLQGCGAAALTPASLALLLQAFPKSRVPQAIALWGAAGALAAPLGPTIGGLFVEAWGWRSVFVVNVPIGIAVAIFGRRLLDESREPDGSRLPDPVGTVVVTVALVLLALAIVQSGAWGWSSTRTVGALLGAVVLLGAFAGRCATVPNPVLALDLFSERGFRWANLGQLLYGTGFTIMFFGNVQFLREVWGYSPVWTGLAMAPGPLVVFVLAPPFGRLAGRIGQRPLLIPGGVISAAAALFLLSRVDAAPAYLAVWLPFTLVSGVGVSMVLPLLTSAAVAGLPSDRFATGSAVNAALRNLGQTLGVAIFVAVAGRTTAGELLAHHRLAWWLVAAAGVAVSATSWWLRVPARRRVRSSAIFTGPYSGRRDRGLHRSSPENRQRLGSVGCSRGFLHDGYDRAASRWRHGALVVEPGRARTRLVGSERLRARHARLRHVACPDRLLRHRGGGGAPDPTAGSPTPLLQRDHLCRGVRRHVPSRDALARRVDRASSATRARCTRDADDARRSGGRERTPRVRRGRRLRGDGGAVSALHESLRGS